jgi:hypothetical protein
MTDVSLPLNLHVPNLKLTLQPNFLRKGDRVRLKQGITGTCLTNSAVDLHSLPRIDVVLLSDHDEYVP